MMSTDEFFFLLVSLIGFMKNEIIMFCECFLNLMLTNDDLLPVIIYITFASVMFIKKHDFFKHASHKLSIIHLNSFNVIIIIVIII